MGVFQALVLLQEKVIKWSLRWLTKFPTIYLFIGKNVENMKIKYRKIQCILNVYHTVLWYAGMELGNLQADGRMGQHTLHNVRYKLTKATRITSRSPVREELCSGMLIFHGWDQQFMDLLSSCHDATSHIHLRNHTSKFQSYLVSIVKLEPLCSLSIVNFLHYLTQSANVMFRCFQENGGM